MGEVPHINTPEGRTVEHDYFMQTWEEALKTIGKEEISKYLQETSPHHPKQNMRWLYDRLLMKLALGE